MNLEADNILEDYGAGFEGTNALRDKYIKDTPGQSIQQFNTEMKQKTYQEFEAQHKKMYPSHTEDQIKAAYKKYSEYSEMDEAYGESWVVYNKDTKAKIKPFKTRKGAYDYAAKEGGVVYSAEYYFDHQDEIHSGKLVKEESLDEAQNLVSKGIYTLDGKKIDGARSSKLFLQALDSDGFLHNLSWKEWSESDLKDTSSDNAKKQFVDRLAKQIKMFNKRIDLNTWLKGGDRSFTDTVNYIFKLDPNIKYAKTSGLKEESLDEAMNPQNTSYGYYGTVDVEKYKLIAYKEMADKVLKIARDKKIFVNFPNITSNTDQESAVVKYLDSKHGRHIADGNDSPIYIEKDFTKFLKDVATGRYMESVDLDEAINIRDYMATSEKSQFGGYTPKVVHKNGKAMYSGQASYNTPDEAKDHAEEYLKQYARGIPSRNIKVPVKGTYVKESEMLDESNQEVFIAGESAGLDVSEISSLMSQALKKYNNSNKAKSELISIFKMIKDSKKDLSKFYGDFSSLSSAVYESKEISLETLRQMKIVALATGSADLDKIYEYVTTQPLKYSSVVELKENFNKYINNA